MTEIWINMQPYLQTYIYNFWYIYVIITLLVIFKKKPEIFGIDIVLGEFGAGKTYNVMREALEYKERYGCFVISNAPYSFVDLKFNSIEDLNKVFDLFVEYFQDTNYKQYLESDNFRPIVFILDEAHLYFFSRNFMKNFEGQTMVTVSQCRKRNILIRFVTQELAQLDSTFRRLVPYVRKYYTGLMSVSFYRDYYMKTDDVDVKNEEKVEIVGKGWFTTPGGYLWQIKHKLLTSKLAQYHSERWVSRFIVGLKLKFGKNMLDDLTYLEFLELLYGEELLNKIPKPKPKKDKYKYIKKIKEKMSLGK